MSDVEVIVLGMDGSQGAQSALDEVIRLVDGRPARVLVSFGYGAIKMGGETKDLEQAVSDLGRKASEAAMAKLATAGIEGEVILSAARPAEALMEVAAEHGATLIAVGSRGERPLIGAVLGSVTHQLVHRSTVPILVCPIRSP